MRLLCALACSAIAIAQTVPLKDRVLILVNDKAPESNAVGQYYAAKRNIPAANIFHLKTSTSENISKEEFHDQVELPLKKFLDANDGAMRRKILYIVPAYGVPLKAGNLALDSVVSMMYAGHEEMKPPLRNPYASAVGTRPPHFAEWSDGVAAANNFKMFAVSRLDGPSAEIAKGLVDKALAGEASLNLKSGIAYFDYQGTRSPSEWQYAIDNEIKAAAELSRKQGFETVLHTQADSLCRSQMPPAPMYLYDAVKKQLAIENTGATTGLDFSFKPLDEADFTMALAGQSVQNIGNTIALKLGAGDRSFIRFVYPLVPFQNWDSHADIVLEKVVDGAVAARTAVHIANEEKAINSFSSLRLSVRKGRISAWRDATEVAAVEDKSGKPLPLSQAGLSAACLCFTLKQLTVADPAGVVSWDDRFATDSTARYQWHLSAPSGLKALWVWGWYGMAFDSYRFVPGAVGAQLTSFTALSIRTPANPDPKVYHQSAARWGGNWVPRMLEQGVTATWGAVDEPYATLYAPGGNVFDHLWAGYNFGDSFYIAEPAGRWVMVAVGDPLYSPKIH
uniref:TIGR03790 family protein n=1 Tax=Solibacter usitatus (strain Ellin6076) TaxID=234267 RepID=Q01NR6_SOLUE